VMPGRGPHSRPGSMFGAAVAQHGGPAMLGSAGMRDAGRVQAAGGGGTGVHSRGMFGTSTSGSRPRAAAPGASAARHQQQPVDVSDDHSLSAPSFMPHRLPSRKLKYARPEGVKKAKWGGPRKGGMLHQTKLCWG
jgi:hypothetical protein